ncbi:MAG TPA: hypothetical protein VFY73_21060 [Ideonella sp.]|uniref:hypothetical protein n=1 Tax=Ideonella sp. TaxID=1929293 RepID=UPI002E31BB8F|nr:hypothetical protein [Ideonella sp.]HEX5686526.1 hypothetical protein [Ideonella sp.]
MNLHRRFALSSVVAMALVAAPLALRAQTTFYDFGQLLSGSGAPETPSFASLSATVSGDDVMFTLDAHGLDLFDGTQPFLGALAIDGDGVGTIADVSGGASVKMVNGGGPGGGWAFRFSFIGKNKDRLVDDETVSWTWVGGAGHFFGVAAHVQGIAYGETTSAWYEVVTTPPGLDTVSY